MKIVFKGEGEINIFIQKPRKVVASGSTVKEILKEVVSWRKAIPIQIWIYPEEWSMLEMVSIEI